MKILSLEELTKLKKQFDKIDKNNNGILELFELKRYFYGKYTIKEIEKLMKDHTSEKGITFECFVDIYFNNKQLNCLTSK